MKWFTYDIECDGTPLYAGHTKNPKQRISQHKNSGLFDGRCSCKVNIFGHSSKNAALKHEKRLVGTKCHTKNKNLKGSC